MFKSWAILTGLLLFFSTSKGQSLPPIVTQPIEPSAIKFIPSEFIKVGKSDTSQFSRLLWDQQDNFERSVLKAFGNIGFGIDILDHNFHNDDYHLGLSIDIRPKRITFPINFGLVKDGTPIADPLYPKLEPKSGILTIDMFQSTLRTDLSSSKLIADAIKTKYPIYVGYGFEMGQIVRKLSLIRSRNEYLSSKNRSENDISAELQKQFNEMDSNNEKLEESIEMLNTGENLSRVESMVENFVKYSISGIEFVYRGLGEVIQKGASYFEDDENTKVFFAGLFDSIELKKKLFTIDAERTLRYLTYGDILSLIQFQNYGPGIGTGIDFVNLNYSKLKSKNREVRITRLSPQNCGRTPNKTVCNKVLVSLITYTGDAFRLSGSASVDLKPFHYNWASTDSADTKFFQVEWQLEFDLNNIKAINAYNLAVKQYRPNMNMALKYGKHAKETGVRLVSLNIIGDSGYMNRGFDEKSPHSITSNTRINIGILARNANTNHNTYKKCQTNFDEDGIPTNNNAPDQCSFNAISSKGRTYTNKIDFRIHSIPFLDPVLDWRAKQDEQQMCEAFANLDKKENHHGVNIHCRYNISDKFTDLKVYQEDYLQSIKTMLGMLEPETQNLYTQSNAPAANLYKKIMSENGLSDIHRKINKDHQNLMTDIFFDDKYTDEIFKNSPDYVKSVIARMLLGDGYTWEHIKYLPNHATVYPEHCRVNPKYEGMIINKYFAQQDVCSEIRRIGFELAGLFKKLLASKSRERIAEVFNFYTERNRMPFVPLLIFLLGKDHAQEIKDGHLAINFYYEAEDLNEKSRFSYGSLIKTAMRFSALPGVNPIPRGGRPRVYNVNVYAEKNSINGKAPDFYLEFYSDLKTTISGKHFGLAGMIQEFVPVLADKPVATFAVDRLIPEEIKIDDAISQYRYVVKLTDPGSAGLKPNKSYVGVFNLEDPDIIDPNGEREHFSEMVEYLVSFKPKK